MPWVEHVKELKDEEWFLDECVKHMEAGQELVMAIVESGVLTRCHHCTPISGAFVHTCNHSPLSVLCSREIESNDDVGHMF